MTDRSDLPGPAERGSEELHPLLRDVRSSLLEALVGQAPVGVGLFDTDARYLSANPALAQIIGLEESQLLGRRIEDVLGTELGLAAGQLLRTVLATGEPLVNAEVVGRTPASPDERTFQVSYFRLTDESGSVVGAASLVSDVTPQSVAREQVRALVLQYSLLHALPTAPGLLAAARYLPAVGEVGGDWYDLIALPSGRVAVVIGDVMGRGIPAAALMGQVRAAVRGYAVQDLPPADVLTYADELVRGLDDLTIVTCVYAVYDPADGCLELANAGHVPPLLAGGSGDGPGVRRVEASGPPLGAGGQEPYEQVSVTFSPHHTLVLYTDGLVEGRGADVEARIETLGASIDHDVDLELLCSAMLEASGQEEAEDDLAILVLRPDEKNSPRVAYLPLRADPSMVGRARAFVVRTLRSWGVAPEDIDLARLVTSELATNGVRYGAGHLSLHLSLRPDSIFVEVRDGSPALPHGRRPNHEAEGGRGLLLVGSLTHSWGTRRLHPRGKAVWCRIRRTPEHAPVDERVSVG